MAPSHCDNAVQSLDARLLLWRSGRAREASRLPRAPCRVRATPGSPRSHLKPKLTLYCCSLRRTYHFPDAFYGQNTRIRDTLNNLILKSPEEWQTNVGLPFVCAIPPPPSCLRLSSRVAHSAHHSLPMRTGQD